MDDDAPVDPQPTVEPAHDPSRMTERRVDVAEGEEVSGIVEDVSDGELLVFPEGRFTWSRKVTTTVDDWGIRGQPDGGTVFEVPPGDSRFLRTSVGAPEAGRESDNVLLENLTFDSEGRSNPGVRLGVTRRGHVENLHYRCNGTIREEPMVNGISAFVDRPDGHLTIQNYRQHNQGRLTDYNHGDGRVAVWIGAAHFGTITFANPVLSGFPNNAFYVGRTPGTVEIRGGYVADNNVSAVRLSGGISVRGTTMALDLEAYERGPGEITGGVGGHNTRLVWGDMSARGDPGGLVENCSFVLRSYEASQGLVTVLENPGFTVRDSQFRLDDEITAVRADDGEIALENCSFVGDADATAGSGDVTGGDNCVADGIDPGAVPTSSRDCEFDWERVHPLARPDAGRPD